MVARTVFKAFIVIYFLLLPSACADPPVTYVESKDGPITLLATLSGDLPVSALKTLPAGQHDQSVGYLVSQQQLDAVLRSIQTGGKTLPTVDFSSQIVLFAKNTVFYNRLSIGQVSRKGETLTILAMETMSAMPITDKVAISLVVIERDGARFIEAGDQKVPIED